MELRQLRYFLKVAQTLNFSLASRELFITQSTLSQQISQLENELQQKLFQRNSHEVLLTEAGEMLLPLAAETVKMAENCVLRLDELRDMLTGEVNIGVTYSFSSIVAETITDFLKRYPHVKLNVVYASMENLMERLQRHDLDLVLAFRPTVQPANVVSQVIFHNHLVAAVGEYHPLARRRRVTISELQRYDMALPMKGLQARNAFDNILTRGDYHLKIKIEVNNVNLLLQLIRQTNYISVLSESAVLNEQGVRGVLIDDDEAGMYGCIHMLRNTYIKRAAREFVDMLGQSTAALANRHVAL